MNGMSTLNLYSTILTVQELFGGAVICTEAVLVMASVTVFPLEYWNVTSVLNLKLSETMNGMPTEGHFNTRLDRNGDVPLVLHLIGF